MHTVLNSRLMDAVMTLRSQGKYTFACSVIVDGHQQAGLLGPRLIGCPNDVQTVIGGSLVDGKRVGGVRRVLPLGQISVDAEVLALLQAVVDAQDAAAAEALAMAAAAHDTDELNRLLWRKHTGSRNVSGQFQSGMHRCEPAGRR